MPRRTVMLLLLCLTASLWAVPEPSEDELAAARHRYAQWRRHPDWLAKLQKYWQEFESRPADKRERILQFDHDLHQEPSSAQARIWNAVERYNAWLERLDDHDRKAVTEAPDKAASLAVIRELRHREWMKGQPRVLRQQWDALKGQARSDFVGKLRDEEKQRQLEWLIASRFWRELDTQQKLPARPGELDNTVQAYLGDYLMPMLDASEKERLKKAEGSWPAFPMTLVELADRHPPALPGGHGPRTIAELPRQLQKVLDKGVKKDKVKAHEGQWPEFAIAVTENAYGKKGSWTGLGHELWPTKFQNLQPAMQKFINEVLQPVLTPDEKLALHHCNEKWPDYPQRIQELARAHDLRPPWYTLPESRDRLELYRLQHEPRVYGYPELPAASLRQFALYELDPAERAKLNLSENDAGSWQRLTEAYFTRRPHELTRLRQLDHVKTRRPDRPGR